MPELQSPELLCVVEDVFIITGRGIVVKPGRWQSGQVQSGNWVEVRTTQGHSHMARVSSVEIAYSAPRYKMIVNADNPAPFLLADVGREDVHKGDEVWSVASLPVDAMPAVAKPVFP